MDELWHLKAACPNRASSQIFPLSVPLNQTETVPDPCMHPYLAQEVCVIERTIRQEPISSNMLNLGSQSFYPKGGWSEFSNPLLASWSGNSQQLRSVFQQIPSSWPSLLPLNQQLYSTSASNASYTGCWPGNSPSPGQDPGLAALQTAVSSHTVQGRDSSRMMKTVHDNMESAMLRSNGLDMCQKALSVSHHASEPDLHSQLAVLPWLSDDRHQRVQRMHAKQQFSLEKNMQPVLDASFNLQPCGPLGSKPRVYCPSLSGSLIGGELILTETGRLGVSCLCHNLLMSVAKFSEHAGLLTVNPGSIVQMEGGESLVQWRKMFFSQLKVKVPEDHLGWDWNDVSSLEMAHASQKTVLAQSCRKDIGLCFQEDSLVVKNRASQVWETSAPLRNSWSTGNVTSKAGLIAMNPCQKGSQDVCEIALKTVGQSFKESTEIRCTPNELLPHNIHGNISRHQDPVVNSPLQGNEVKGSPVSECIELIKKINKSYIPEMNTSFSFPRKNLQMGVGLSGRSHGQDAVQLGKDLMTSNFELRLGQPSQQTLSHGPSFSRSSESALSAVGSKSFIYERASLQVWDQSSQQCSRPSSRCIDGCTGGGGLRQSSEGVQILNYCNDMKMNGELPMKHVPAGNAEDDRVVAASNQMQPVIICYANNPSMFADSCKGSDGLEQFRNKMNALAVRPLAESIEVPQLLKNRAIDKHRRVGVSYLDQENLTNQIRSDSPAESVNVLGSAQTQSSVLHVKPRIERSDCRKSAVSSYFPPHSTLSDKLSVSLTGPAERESSTLESMAVKNSVNQCLASSLRSCDGSQIAQIKGAVHGATSEGLSASSWNELQQHTISRLFQMRGKEHDQQARVSVDSGRLETAGQNLSGSTAGVSDISMTLMQARKPSDHRELYPPEGIEEKKDLSNVSHGDVAKPVLEKPCSVQGESVLQFENKNTCNRAYLGENDPADHCQLKSEKRLPYCKDVEQEGQTLATGDKGLDRDVHQEGCQFMEIHKCTNVANAKVR